MLMGNIPLSAQHMPVSPFYFSNLPENFRESALLDRFHCFIEGWLLPRVDKSMIFKGWTINVEYFSEILHTMRTQNTYGLLFDQLVRFEEKADVRDSNAVKRIATAYMKLLFPHWQRTEDVNEEEFKLYCLDPAVHRRGIVKEQCHNIDPEFKSRMPYVEIAQKGFTENKLF